MTFPSEDTRCKFCRREVEVEPKKGVTHYRYRLGNVALRIEFALEGQRVCPSCLRTAVSKAEHVG